MGAAALGCLQIPLLDDCASPHSDVEGGEECWLCHQATGYNDSIDGGATVMLMATMCVAKLLYASQVTSQGAHVCMLVTARNILRFAFKVWSFPALSFGFARLYKA